MHPNNINYYAFYSTFRVIYILSSTENRKRKIIKLYRVMHVASVGLTRSMGVSKLRTVHIRRVRGFAQNKPVLKCFIEMELDY